MNKENCTKGPVYDYKGEVREDDPVSGRTIATVSDRLRDDEIEPNAELIAEAFNVLNETGYTPAELARQVEEMREALQALVDDDEADDRDGDRKRRYFENASEVLSKYQPTNA